MLSIISTLGGILTSGLPSLLDYFVDKGDKKHELELARLQNERELAMAERGFIAEQRVEEIRTDQIEKQAAADERIAEMQTEAQMTSSALDHDKRILDRASKWVASYVGTVRPTVTYILVLELVAINVAMVYWLFTQGTIITSIDEIVQLSEIIFSQEEMAMLGGIIGFWFGSRAWNKK